MDRIFLPASLRDGARFRVDGAERRHLTALRIRAGDRFLATDGEGREYLLAASAVSKAAVVADVVEERVLPRGAGARVTLAVAPPKGTRMETAVEKCTECGVGRIIPMLTERSVVRGKDGTERLARWRRVACSATAQSEAAWVPEITGFVPFADVVAAARAEGGALLLAHPGDGARPVVHALADAPRDAAVTVLVGPEGGFRDEEAEHARRAGAIAVTLGPQRLRTETAAIVAVALAIAALHTREGA